MMPPEPRGFPGIGDERCPISGIFSSKLAFARRVPIGTSLAVSFFDHHPILGYRSPPPRTRPGTHPLRHVSENKIWFVDNEIMPRLIVERFSSSTEIP